MVSTSSLDFNFPEISLFIYFFHLKKYPGSGEMVQRMQALVLFWDT